VQDTQRSPYTDAVAAQIRAEIAAANLTYKDVSASTGIHIQTLYRYIHGTRDIPMPVLFQIAEALEVPAPAIVARAEARLKPPPQVDGIADHHVLVA